MNRSEYRVAVRQKTLILLGLKCDVPLKNPIKIQEPGPGIVICLSVATHHKLPWKAGTMLQTLPQITNLDRPGR